MILLSPFTQGTAVAQWVKQRPADVAVSSSISQGQKSFQPQTVPRSHRTQPFITAHRPDMTEILLKKMLNRKLSIHPTYHLIQMTRPSAQNDQHY